MFTWEEQAARSLTSGAEYPYDGLIDQTRDQAELAALGILYDLCDRRGIKWALRDVDADIRREIVVQMAAVIRASGSVKPERA